MTYDVSLIINVIKGKPIGLNDINKEFSKCLDCAAETLNENCKKIKKISKLEEQKYKLEFYNQKYRLLIENYYAIINNFKKQINISYYEKLFRESFEKFCNLCKDTAKKLKGDELRSPKKIEEARQELIKAFDDITKPLGSDWKKLSKEIMEKVLKLGYSESDFMIRLYEVNEEVKKFINGYSTMSVSGSCGSKFRDMDNAISSPYFLYKDLNILGISCKDIWENYKEALNVKYEKL